LPSCGPKAALALPENFCSETRANLEDVMAMYPAERETYRRRLEELAQRHGDDVTELREGTSRGLGGESGGSISNAPTHLADLGVAHHEREVDLLLLENQEGLLAECHAALRRLAAGTFGLCAGCSREIPRRRLNVFPYARFCVGCAAQMERREEEP
jgi:DnaK suppressor protein